MIFKEDFFLFILYKLMKVFFIDESLFIYLFLQIEESLYILTHFFF